VTPPPPGPQVDAALAALVVATGREHGLDAVGVCTASPFAEAREALERRKAQGLHGGMQFTYRNPARSTDVAQSVPGARSLVVAARRYPSRTAAPPADGVFARVAAYAWSDHYGELRRGLDAIAAELRTRGHTARVLVDDNALVDRAAAVRAGLGFYGKNANVLLPGQGSWFVLGAVATDAELCAADPPLVADGCGPCRRCLDGCPTGAIVAPGVIDARRCLAWLVQAEGDFPVEHRAALGDRLYGCDDCQEACPPARRPANRPVADGTAAAWVDVVELLTLDDRELLARHGRWYIPRREPRYLRRNALVVLGNSGRGDDPEVVAVLERYRRHPDAMLRRHARWAVERLGLAGAGAGAGDGDRDRDRDGAVPVTPAHRGRAG
jgi:epoxyqueuosine reductase